MFQTLESRNRLQLPRTLLNRHARTGEILREVRLLRAKPSLSESDLRRLAELRAELAILSPPERYGWVDGLPVVDILGELVAIRNSRRQITNMHLL